MSAYSQLPNFSFLRSSVLELGSRSGHTDRQTDRRTDGRTDRQQSSVHNAYAL